MAAYLVLLLAVLSRILPHAFHAVSWNFTAVGGSLLFFGSRMSEVSSTGRFARLAVLLVALMATDYYLTVYAFGYPFHLRGYLVTWAWCIAVCLLGSQLSAKPSAVRVVVGVLASATSFFLFSNFAVWAAGGLYPHTLAGLGTCYVAAIPFYRNDLVSTSLVAGALFGLPVLATKIVETIQAAHNDNLPAA